jgi:hypothetical protein
MKLFRTMLFQRIVPIVRDIGLWSDKIQKAYADMGVLVLADTDFSALMADDDKRAREFDEQARDERARHVQSVIDLGAAGVAAE